MHRRSDVELEHLPSIAAEDGRLVFGVQPVKALKVGRDVIQLAASTEVLDGAYAGPLRAEDAAVRP